MTPGDDKTEPQLRARLAEVDAEMKRLSAALEALPLANENKKERLRLSHARGALIGEREQLENALRCSALRAEIESLRKESRDLPDEPAGRKRKTELRRVIADREAELSVLQPG